MRVYVSIMLYQPVNWLAKYHAKRCLESQNNATGHTTFVGMEDMSARPVLVARHMLICLVFLTLILIYFLGLHCLGIQFFVSWNTSYFPVTDICPFNTLFLVICLLFLITIYLFMVLSITIVYIGCLYIGICCWIFDDVVEYVCSGSVFMLDCL